MNPKRFREITSQYVTKRIAVVGDFCLDRYFEIDPLLKEVSIETGLEVFNVVRTRSQPGGAGTVLNNLSALGAGTLPVGICGNDPEGRELVRLLGEIQNCTPSAWKMIPGINTFSYNKPLVIREGEPPRELNRLDIKNWSPLSETVQDEVVAGFRSVIERVDGCILMEQVDKPGTGVLSQKVLSVIAQECAQRKIPCMGDSRLGLSSFPPMIFKMNRAELTKLSGQEVSSLESVREVSIAFARKNTYPVFVTLAEEGMGVATPEGDFFHEKAILLPGPLDVVGAGDAVSANLMLAQVCGASVVEAMELAMGAAALVVHKLGTTGTASVSELEELLQK